MHLEIVKVSVKLIGEADDDLHKPKYIVVSDLDADNLFSLNKLIQAGLQQPLQGEQKLNYDFFTNKEIPGSLVDVNRSQQQKINMTNSFMCASNIQPGLINQPNTTRLHRYPTQWVIWVHFIILPHLGQNNSSMEHYSQILQYNIHIHVYIGDLSFLNLAIFSNRTQFYIQAYKQYESERDTQQRIQFTKPATHGNGNAVGVSLIMPQVDNDDNFIGAWATDFTGQKFTQYLKLNNLIDHALLVTKDGILLVHNFETSKNASIIYIYQEEVTGYSIQDWEIIQRNNNANSKLGSSDNNCDITYQIPGQLCRYNNLLNKELYVLSVYLSKYEFYIVILSDQSELKTEIDKLNTTIVKYIQKMLSDIVIYSTVILFMALIVTQIVIRLAIIQPINNVIRLIQQNLSPTTNSLLRLKTQTAIFKTIEIQNLLNAFNNLFSKFSLSQLKKTSHCKLFENFKHPKQELPTHELLGLPPQLLSENQQVFRLDQPKQAI